jgi:hypothetical protein
VAPAADFTAMRVLRGFRAEALSLSHLTWDTTMTVRFHIFWITLLSSVEAN